MSQPIHTPGPLKIRRASNPDNTGGVDYALATEGSVEILAEAFENVGWKDPAENEFIRYPAEANARLLAAAYNAFDSAAKKLGCNAVELAECMADGGVAALVEAVQAAKEMSDWFMEHSRQADHAHSELKQPLHETEGWRELVGAGYNGLMASYQGQFEEALSKVKGGTL